MVTSSLQKAIQDIQSTPTREPTEFVPLPSGVLTARRSTPFGQRTVEITNGAFSVSVPNQGEGDAYRLLVKQRFNFAGHSFAVPLLRSGDLPRQSTSGLRFFALVASDEDLDFLNVEAIVTNAQLDQIAQRAADSSDEDRLVEAHAKTENNRLRVDFVAKVFERLGRPRVKGTLLLEPEPSTSYLLERLVELKLIDFQLDRFHGKSFEDADFVKEMVNDAVDDISNRVNTKIEIPSSLPPGVTITLQGVTEPADGIHLTIVIGYQSPSLA